MVTYLIIIIDDSNHAITKKYGFEVISSSAVRLYQKPGKTITKFEQSRSFLHSLNGQTRLYTTIEIKSEIDNFNSFNTSKFKWSLIKSVWVFINVHHFTF